MEAATCQKYKRFILIHMIDVDRLGSRGWYKKTKHRYFGTVINVEQIITE